MPLDTAALAAHRHSVYAFALRLTGSREDAADVTQDVLVRLWRHGEDVPEEQRKPWVLRVTRNAAIDLIRRRKTRNSHTIAHEALLEHAATHTHSLDTLTEASDFRDHLERALGTLDEPYRSIVILREIQGFSYQDIADALELPLNTLKVYLHRARRRLRERLMEMLPVEELPL